MHYIYNENLNLYWNDQTRCWSSFSAATVYSDHELAVKAAIPIITNDSSTQLKIVDAEVMTQRPVRDAANMPLTIGQIAALCSVANGNYADQYAKDTKALSDMGLIFTENANYQGQYTDVCALTAKGHRHIASLLSVRVGMTIHS